MSITSPADLAPRRPRILPPLRATVAADYRGPRIALIHGLMAREYVQGQLLHYLRDAGYADTTQWGHLAPVRAIVEDLQQAAQAGRGIAIVGYSQGGFHAVKVARELQRRRVALPLLVTIAAGGKGRWMPAQWGFDPRPIPANVGHCLNVFAAGDGLGTDRHTAHNHAHAQHPATRIENIALEPSVSHTGIVRCYPAARVHPQVKTRLLERLLAELEGLNRAG